MIPALSWVGHAAGAGSKAITAILENRPTVVGSSMTSSSSSSSTFLLFSSHRPCLQSRAIPVARETSTTTVGEITSFTRVVQSATTVKKMTREDKTQMSAKIPRFCPRRNPGCGNDLELSVISSLSSAPTSRESKPPLSTMNIFFVRTPSNDLFGPCRCKVPISARHSPCCPPHPSHANVGGGAPFSPSYCEYMAGILPHIFSCVSASSPPPTPQTQPSLCKSKRHLGHFSFVQVGIRPHAQIAAGAVESPGAVAVVVYPCCQPRTNYDPLT